LLTDEQVPAGDYNWVRLTLSEESGDLFAMRGDTGPFSIRVPSGFQTGLKLVSGFTIPAGGKADFTIDFDVRKSLVDPQGNPQADYFLKPALRLIDNVEAGSITGTVNASTIIATECADSQTYSGLVYVYEGNDVTPSDFGSDAAPLVAAPVSDNNSPGTYIYKAAFLSEGAYTISYSCTMDDNEVDEDLTYVGTRNVTVVADEETTANFE
jgi:hypothetical protein